MKTKIGTFFDLALLLVLGLLAVMLALGMLSPPKAEASFERSTDQMVSVLPALGVVDPGGGPANRITVTSIVTVAPDGTFLATLPQQPQTTADNDGTLTAVSGSGFTPEASITISFTTAGNVTVTDRTFTVKGLQNKGVLPPAQSLVSGIQGSNVLITDNAIIATATVTSTTVPRPLSTTRLTAHQDGALANDQLRGTQRRDVGILPQLVGFM